MMQSFLHLIYRTSVVSPYLTFARIILIIATVLAVGFSVWNLILHPKLLKKTLVTIVASVAVLVISYMLADDGAVTDMYGKVIKDGEAGSTSKWVSTGIWYTAILFLAGFVVFLLGVVKSLFKA
ncbi:MAG: hypothetical protein U5K51_04835 [Flavobacteriaceae bacterium]|nr:hypothetical protein [Flavobacteriaceae bacterium]